MFTLASDERNYFLFRPIGFVALWLLKLLWRDRCLVTDLTEANFLFLVRVFRFSCTIFWLNMLSWCFLISLAICSGRFSFPFFLWCLIYGKFPFLAKLGVWTLSLIEEINFYFFYEAVIFLEEGLELLKVLNYANN